ncbi:MAG: Ig-like domain-containing protein [Pirellula sp.]
MSRKTTSRKASKRLRVFETLERREMMANDFSEAVRAQLATMMFVDQAAYENAGQMITERLYGVSNSSGSGSGENNTPFNASEIEPNGVRPQANFLPLGTSDDKTTNVNIAGQMQTILDEDYFSFDLRKGDILDARIVVPSGTQPGLILMTGSGTELLYSKQVFYPPIAGRPTTLSPRFTTGAATLSYVIDHDGRYLMRVGDATGSYTLNLRVYRPTIEREAVGTKQKIFLDFDGSFIRNDILSLNLFGTAPTPGQTIRVPSFYNFLPTLGLNASRDGDALARDISARVEKKLRFELAGYTTNGFFGQTGHPGDFDVQILNSVDHVDVWGQANVSRVLIGGTQTQIGIPAATGLLGIAQSIDIGNFDREESALVMLDILGADALDAIGVPRAGNVSAASIFAELTAVVIAHEVGHYLGSMHQDPNSRVNTIMDSFYDPLAQAGRDGILGNSDDEFLRFDNDDYNPNETRFGGGINNSGNILAFGMSTGTVGTLVTGISYNDKNRNARQDAGEAGLVGWEVFSDINGNGVRDLNEPRATTDANGRYNLTLGAGVYNLRVTRPPSWIASTSTELVKTITLVAGVSQTVNFGSVIPSDIATGFKWNDLNGDGIKDAGEPGLVGVYIYLDLDGDDRPDLAEPASLTKADGSFSLTPPGPGVYAIREVIEPGFVQTFPGAANSFEHIVTYDGSNPLRGFNFGNLESSDFGDAPAPYPTTRAANGAAHGATPGLRLGTNWDSDGDGRPTPNADGDDLVGQLNSSGGVIDDEDGVVVIAPIVRGDTSNIIQVTVTNSTGATAFIQGWVDFNGNGNWSDPGEQIALNVPAVNGQNNITFTTPSNAVSRTFARFRLSQDQNLGPAGKSQSGEVEDYVFNIVDGPRRLLQPDTFTVARNSTLNPFDVLANDFQLPNDPWTITSVSLASAGGRILIGANGKSLSYSPALSFVGRDEFTYTATSQSGRRETTTVLVNVTLQFNDPVAVDDSFDVPMNSVGFPLSVLANDVEGRGGALIVSSITSPDKGGTASIGSGGQSIRYTPARGFGGTETFEYTVTDATGKTSKAKITIHTVQGDRADDEVEFSFRFLNAANEPITEVRQGDTFKVVVLVDDLRPEKAALETPPRNVTDPGIYSAYLDLLYSTGLVSPNAPRGGSLDFAATFVSPYRTGIEGSASTPGIINELGAFIGSVTSFSEPNPLPVVILEFTAASAGIAEFVGDPADNLPSSEVTFYNTPSTRVPTEQIRYGRSSIEIVPNGVNFPFAVDDSRFNITSGSPFNVDVLTNDVTGTQPPIRISSITQPANGQTSINNNNTPNNFADDTITYVSVANFEGLDQFKYTITDERGFVSTATVTIHVGAGFTDDSIRLRLDATDLSGTPIDQIVVGQQFQLRGFVEDLRTGASRPGVFAAFQDVLYDTRLVSVNTQAADPFFQVVYANAYNNGKSGDIRIPGVINEIGSVQSDTANPTGLGEKLQFIVTLTARNTGIANFIGDPADIKPFHDSLVFDPTTPLMNSQIRYVADSLRIISTAGGGGSSGGEGNTNLTNQYDVNNDGFVSPIDVLILVNSMNTGGGGLLPSGSLGAIANGEGGSAKYFLDVNGDNYLSPLDALAIINHLNDRTTGSAEGEASPSVPSTSDLTSDPFRVSMVFDDLLSDEDDEDDEDDDDQGYLNQIASDVYRNS